MQRALFLENGEIGVCTLHDLTPQIHMTPQIHSSGTNQRSPVSSSGHASRPKAKVPS